MGTKDILAKRLEELSELKKDEDFTLSIKRQAEDMDIPYPTFQKYYHATSECSISNLAKIANYYNVSCDYLLGITKSKSRNTKIQDTIRITGLSESAIEGLKRMHSNEDNTEYLIDAINLLITEPYLLQLIHNYLLSDENFYKLFDDNICVALAYRDTILKADDIMKVFLFNIISELKEIRERIQKERRDNK